MERVSQTATIEEVLRRDRAFVLTGVLLLTFLSWGYLIHMAWEMDHAGMEQMSMEMAMPQMQAWTVTDLALLFLMWAVMMVAMMVPSATPMVLMFARINRERNRQQRPYVSTAVFLSGYILIWTAYSAAATLAQWGLHSAALLSPMMVSTSHMLGGVLLIAAGLFQWTPLKRACLTHCRSPLHFIMMRWKEGKRGAVLMGVEHGSYCVGCCWILMALLFVAGVMNLLWVALIAGFVLLEKVVPQGELVGRIAGVLLCAAGLFILFS